MDRSSAIAITAEASRGDAVHGEVPNDYAVLLPVLPTGDEAKCSLVLHADTRGRPYRVEDFVGPLNQVGVREDITGLGAYQMGHVWLVKLRTGEAKEKLLSAGNLKVKNRLCLIVDPVRRELRVKVQWLLECPSMPSGGPLSVRRGQGCRSRKMEDRRPRGRRLNDRHREDSAPRFLDPRVSATPVPHQWRECAGSSSRASAALSTLPPHRTHST